MTPREILTAAQGAMIRAERSDSDRALLAMHALLVHFLDATDKGCPESMKAMSIDQIRLLNPAPSGGGPMKDLIEALTILAKYTNAESPTICEHDELRVLVDPAGVTPDDKARLKDLGFLVHERDECFHSFRFGSA